MVNVLIQPVSVYFLGTITAIPSNRHDEWSFSHWHRESFFVEKKILYQKYCWWTKSCTTKDDDYPIIYRVLTIPGGAGFRPSTVSPRVPGFPRKCRHLYLKAVKVGGGGKTPEIPYSFGVRILPWICGTEGNVWWNVWHYCWWFRNPAITSWYGKYPIIYRVFAGFLPPTVFLEKNRVGMGVGPLDSPDKRQSTFQWFSNTSSAPRGCVSPPTIPMRPSTRQQTQGSCWPRWHSRNGDVLYLEVQDT